MPAAAWVTWAECTDREAGSGREAVNADVSNWARESSDLEVPGPNCLPLVRMLLVFVAFVAFVVFRVPWYPSVMPDSPMLPDSPM